MLRMTKILLIVSVAFWCLLGAFGNATDWDGTMGAVGAAASMSTFEGGAESWRASSSPVVIWMGALMIMLTKLAAGILCSIGAVEMWRARAGDVTRFALAKRPALAGCGVAMLLLFGGFIVIGETWFEMWRSDVLRDLSLQSAFRYGAMVTLIALYVGCLED